jgi:hypothetical protein
MATCAKAVFFNFYLENIDKNGHILTPIMVREKVSKFENVIS